MRVASLLNAHPEGMRPKDIAERLGMSVRNVYRDLKALEGEVGLPTWSEDGRWGILESAFLPPLKLNLSEAMAVFLGARLMVRYADKYDPDLASAFEKLAASLPDALREHVGRSLDVLQDAPLDAEFIDHVRQLTRAWADRRVVEITYEGAAYEGRPGERSRRVVRPYLIEPSLQTHALYLIGFDEDRAAMRTFKIERIHDVRVTPRSFEPPEGATLERDLRRGWDIIADQPSTDIVLHFSPAVADRVLETTWHPLQTHRAIRRTVPSSGAPRSAGSSRSGCGSSPGETTWRSSSRRTCVTRSGRSSSEQPPATPGDALTQRE